MKKTLVLGASLKPHRYSNMAIRRLRDHRQPVVAVGLKEGEVHGVPVKRELNNDSDIHTITLYLNAGNQKPWYDQILEIKPDRVIFNPGTENPELYRLLDEHGIAYENACTLVMLSSGQY
ncbi:CoA-binding protein [Robertkochia aurantiaca]|uniref:CoA-binding protein n=1 Tax=Robertkochia aurantiaca TaxID=2873700 RepID=UPI001CC94968|nr:CoA-binding protein [Robertkochia sp. 3YJGBD-33]